MRRAAVIRVACAQLAPVLGDLAGNRMRAADAVRRGADAGAQLVVLPELCTSGYVFRDVDEARGLAEPLDGPAVTTWRELARERELVVVAGVCELRPEGRLGNTAVLIDRGELVQVYRKTHLWDREPDVFDPGSDPPPVLDTSVGRLGLAICYDTFFPEVMRGLALAGAELIAAPMNVPVLGEVLSPHPAEVVVTQAAAIANRVFVAACDRAGAERGVDWVGASAIIDPSGRLLAAPGPGPHLLVADADLTLARDKRLGPRNDAFSDRRSELYRA